MREMVFRERQERVAHLDAIGKMIGRVLNVDAEKAFSGILADYAGEVFQETYDADLLKKKISIKKAAQARVAARRRRDEELIRRLDRMGDFYDDQIAKKDK